MKKTKRKSNPFENISRALQDHITALGVDGVRGYQRWCRENGCGRSLEKNWRQLAHERSLANAPAVERRSKQQRYEVRNFHDVVQSVCVGELTAEDVASPLLKQLSYVVGRKQIRFDGRPVSRRGLARLLAHVHGRRAKFFDTRAITQPDGLAYLNALIAIAARQSQWVRPLDEWKPRSHNANRQFGSLVRHLFATYDVPSFLDSAWLAGVGDNAARQRGWFVHVGKGQNIRRCDTPITLTKKMAHLFLQAPSTLTIHEAFRWTQVHAFGGDDRLARALCGTRLVDSFDHDDFWSSVIRWFIAHPMLDRAQVGPIVDYLHNQKFVDADVMIGNGRAECPAQPSLAMKGRCPEALLRNVAAWHRRLASDNRVQVCQWLPQAFGGLEFDEGDRARRGWRRWTIRELVSSQALTAEGRAMRHCVSSYASSCARGTSSIWTMEVQTHGQTSKALTIEVRNAQRLICQVRGRLNREATQVELSVLRRWASNAGLKLAQYV